MADVRVPHFWEQRYQEGRTGWDLGGPTPGFVAYLEGAQPAKPGKILVVGCGKGHDVLLFARHGFDALGVDFAPSAVEIGTRAAQEAGLADGARFEQADIFDLPARYPAHFHYVLERACYCAIDPADRARYVDTVAALLKPGGRIIGQFFLGPQTRPGPPFAATVEELKESFAPHFEFERQDAPYQGKLPGADLFGILRRK
ncbi:MAG TPA: methyltransferase domain-containing protein [Chloroflexota bacterium]|nr:methyltransferase domain-containing protein [Chloroflexota bacterium]